MNKEKAIIILNLQDKHIDLEIPLNITANDLIIGLNEAYNLNIDILNVKDCYLRAENPFVLLKGNRLLYEYGIRNGTVINVCK